MKLALKRFFAILFVILLLTVSAVGGYMFASVLADGGLTTLEICILAPVFFVAYYLTVAVHEAGHLVFGLLTGYSFSSYRIASFMWVLIDGKIRFKRFSLVGTGGQCLMIPPETDEDGRMPVFLYNMGGAFFNLIFGAAAIAVYFLVNGPTLLKASMLIFAALNFLTALFNGIPLRVGGLNNDGSNALSLGKDKAAVRALRLQMLMNAEQTRGVRIKDMPEEWFAEPTEEEMKNPITATIAVFRCNRLMDEYRFAEANDAIFRLLNSESGIVSIHRSLLECDRIYCELMGEGRREIVDSILDTTLKTFMRSMKKFPSVIRTEYVIALLHENNREKAENIEKIFEKYTKNYPYDTDREAERELMRLALEHYLRRNDPHTSEMRKDESEEPGKAFSQDPTDSTDEMR